MDHGPDMRAELFGGGFGWASKISAHHLGPRVGPSPRPCLDGGGTFHEPSGSGRESGGNFKRLYMVEAFEGQKDRAPLSSVVAALLPSGILLPTTF